MNNIDSKLEKLIVLFTENPFEKPRELFSKDISIATKVIFESSAVEDDFKGLDWKDNVKTPFVMLRRFEEGLKYPRDFLIIFNDEALLFYLPVFLSAIIIDPEEADVMIDSLITKFESKILLDKLSDTQKEFYREIMKSYS